MDALRRALCASALGVVWPVRAAAKTPMRIGVTAVMLTDQSAFLARWGRYLAARTGAAVRFSAREEYQPVLDMLFNRALDAAWICGYPFVRHQSTLRLLAVPLYQGAPLYQSYLIRPRGTTAVQGWGDLRGRVLAMSDPLSNSGWLVAQHQLLQAGVTPDALRRGFFAHGHRNVAEAVAVGLADAGSIDGYVWDTMQRLGLQAALDTEVVWRSPRYGFPPLVVPAGASLPTVGSLRDALLGMPQDAEGRALLEALNLDGFVEADASLFASIRALAAAVPGAGVSR